MHPESYGPGETVYPVDDEQPSRYCQNPFCGVRFDLIDPFDTEVLCGDCAEGGEPFGGCPVTVGVRLSLSYKGPWAWLADCKLDGSGWKDGRP